MKAKISKFLSLALALMLALGTTSLAWADTYSADNDVYSPGNQNNVTWVADPGATVTTSADLVVDYQGSKHLTPNSSVVFSVSTSQTSLPSGYSVSTVTGAVPGNWDDTTDQFIAGTSTISFTAPSVAGTYSYTVKWNDAETCASQGDCLTGANAFNITLTVNQPAPADTTSPEITPSVVGALGSNGWYVSDVTLSWSVVDDESPVTTSGCDAVTIDYDTAGATFTCTAISAGGKASASVTIMRDATPPDVSLVGGPADGASYYFAFVPAAPTCIASDATSGLAAPCAVSGYSSLVGGHTVSATAADNAGNQATASASYTVLAWTLYGFYQPVDMNGVYNTVKNGSTVPLKFEIFAGPTELTDTGYVKSLTYAQTTCDATATTDEIETTATGGTSLRYDATAGQFVYNWKTPSTPGKCYRVTLATQDSSSLVAYFKLK